MNAARSRTKDDPWGGLPTSARRVALEVLVHGPLSRTELAARLGFSTASLTRLTKTLLERGLVAELPDVNRPVSGRPLQPLDIAPGDGRFVGIKLTADTAHGVCTDLRAGVTRSGGIELASREPPAVAATLACLVDELVVPGRPTAVGVALGGSVTDGSRVRRAPFLGWRDVDLGCLVAEHTGVPAVIANDLDALVAAEHWFGHGRGVQSFAVLTIGASVGGGLVVHDRLVTSRDAGLGLLGHFPIDPLGPACAEGHRGCAHSLMSIEAIQTTASLAYGRHVTFDEVLALAAADDATAARIVGIAVRGFGTLIAAVANIALPELVVLTGEGIALADVGWDALVASVAAARNREAEPVRLELVPDEPDLWARGAAAVAIQHTVLGHATT